MSDLVSNPKQYAATRDSKAPLDLLEGTAEEAIARALQTGALKYGKKNYRTIRIFASTYGAAIRRHIDAWNDGEEDDPESGLSHLAHIGANLHVLFGAMDAGTFEDDRGPQPRTEEQEEASARSNAQHSASDELNITHVTAVEGSIDAAEDIGRSRG
jgi:hypothetical protein